MRGFSLAVAAYAAACLIAIAVIVIRGDGPHPRVVAIYPSNGDQFWPGGTAQITFSQSMDQSSVERALQVSPGSQGEGVWYGNTLNLQPVGDWRPNVTYRVMLQGSVADAQGRPLHTPFTFWFRVHHVSHLTRCDWRGVSNVCERIGAKDRALTHSAQPVLSFALSPDGTLVAYTRRDKSGLPHLFIVGVDGTGARQLTFGRAYADSQPSWIPGDNSSVTYRRRPVQAQSRPVQVWNVQIDGSSNSRLS
ncbi:MAG TPA: Ig-like domain-containing protein [Chloroflexota bacterium]